MTPRDIVYANLNQSGAPRPGMTFSRGRINDFCCGGMDKGLAYRQKRWIEGDVEYYDDVWGNLWKRMKDGCVKGEICKPVIEDWSQLDDLRAPEFDMERGVAQLKQTFEADEGERFKVASVANGRQGVYRS